MWGSLHVREPRSVLVHMVVNNRDMELRRGYGTIHVYQFMSPQDPVAKSAKGFPAILVPNRGFGFKSSRVEVSVFHQRRSIVPRELQEKQRCLTQLSFSRRDDEIYSSGGGGKDQRSRRLERG